MGSASLSFGGLYVDAKNRRDHRGIRPFRDSPSAVVCASLQDEEALRCQAQSIGRID